MLGDDLSHCAPFNVTFLVNGREKGGKQRHAALFLFFYMKTVRVCIGKGT